MKRFCAASLLAAVSIAQPVAAQWGVMDPDGSIRGDVGIYRGGILQSGPNPSRSLQICMQTGLC